MKRLIALLGLLATFAVANIPATSTAADDGPKHVFLPEGTVLDRHARPVLSLDNTVGFLAPAAGDTLVAFAVATGEVIGRLPGRAGATGLALSETASRRLLAVTAANDPAGGVPATVTVVDATLPGEMRVVSVFSPPVSVALAAEARAEILRDQRHGVVGVAGSAGALVTFDVETGQQVGALTLGGAPDGIWLSEVPDGTRVAVLISGSNTVVVAAVGDHGEILPVSSFTPPSEAEISPANNVGFDASGTVGFVAAMGGHALLSFSLETGELVDRLEVSGSPASLAVYHAAEGDRVAVVNVSRARAGASGGEPDQGGEPLGAPGAVIVMASEGKFGRPVLFAPDASDEIGARNNLDFSADGETVFVPARSGALYFVHAQTGASRRLEMAGRVQAIAAAPLAEAVAVIRDGGDGDNLAIVSATPRALPSGPEPGEPATRQGDAGGDERRERRKGAALTLERVAPGSVQRGRSRDLQVTAIGSGFEDGATVVVAGGAYPALVARKGKRADFTLPAALFASVGSLSIQVRNVDGSVSNAVELTISEPLGPVIEKIRPGKILTGRGAVDLQVRGDHFREGAVATVTYSDAGGEPVSVALRTYRIGFTHIVARLPEKLTVRSRQLQLTVVDRDPALVSAPAAVEVLGPSVTATTPKDVVAGDADFTLHIEGQNFHPDVRVAIRSPQRRAANNETARFVSLDASRLRRRSDTKLSLKIAAGDYRYSGPLVVRIVNPVPGESKGDAITREILVAGPVVTATSPGAIVAADKDFVLKIEGTNFRPGARVQLKREDATAGGWRRVGADHTVFKDREHINVHVNTSSLANLLTHPGNLLVRVVNPNGEAGDASPRYTVGVVGPALTSYDLVPADADDSRYRLQLTGQNFRAGATVRLLNADGQPLDGEGKEVIFKSDTKVAVLLSRSRVTSLQTFQVVIVNPGGAESNALGVTLEGGGG